MLSWWKDIIQRLFFKDTLGWSTTEATATATRSRGKMANEVHLAAFDGDLPSIQRLVTAENVDDIDRLGWTALHLASMGGHTPVVEYLLGHGDSIEIQDTKGWTSLMRASAHGRKKVVKLLLENGANLNTVNDSGETALDTARRQGHREIMELLSKTETERIPKECSNQFEEPQNPFREGTALLQSHFIGMQGCSIAAEPINRADLELDRNNRLGSGTFGFVYKCNFIGVNVAVKELKLTFSKKTKTKADELLIQDILVSTAVHHPCIVQFMGYCSENQGRSNYLLLVYEQIHGHNLEDILTEVELQMAYDFTQTRSYHVLLQVSQAIAYLHSQQPHVIHGNIKPSNIMVTTSGSAKICDLGLSKIKQSCATSLAINPAALYTILYMAPEQLLHPKTSTTKSDVYAFGIMLYKVVFDEDLWEVNDFEEFQVVLGKMRNPKSLPLLQERVNHPAYGVIAKCLEYDYHKRPESWSLVNDVEALYSAACSKGHNTFSVNQI